MKYIDLISQTINLLKEIISARVNDKGISKIFSSKSGKKMEITIIGMEVERLTMEVITIKRATGIKLQKN